MSEFDLMSLSDLAQQTMERSDKLRITSLRLHGREEADGNGEIRRIPGVKITYEEAIDEALLAIAEPYLNEGKRPPAEDIRAAMARKRVKQLHPDLYDEYHILEATMRRLERWLRDARSATMARQSVLKTERELAGKPGGYQ